MPLRIHAKETAIGLLALVGLAAVGFSGYTLFEKFRTKYEQEGYASALQQMVQQSETNKELTVTVGDKSVKFIVVIPSVTPAGETPTPPVPSE